MFPVVQLGPFAIQTPLLLLLLGLWVALSAGSRFAHKFQVEAKLLDDLVLLSILAGLVGGRVFYILRFPQAFLENPTSVLSINPELFLPSGALLVGGIAFLMIIQRKNANLWQIMDALTLPFAIFSIFLGLSHLASGSVYGTVSNLPWAIELYGAARHPTQVYEILAAFAVFGLIWRQLMEIKKSDDSGKFIPGRLFLSFIFMTSLMWILIEPLRADSVYILGNLRLVQSAAYLILLISIWLRRQTRSILDQMEEI